MTATMTMKTTSLKNLLHLIFFKCILSLLELFFNIYICSSLPIIIHNLHRIQQLMHSSMCNDMQEVVTIDTITLEEAMPSTLVTFLFSPSASFLTTISYKNFCSATYSFNTIIDINFHTPIAFTATTENFVLQMSPKLGVNYGKLEQIQVQLLP